MALSSANVVQAKIGTADSVATAPVTLDNPTQAGSTVLVEIAGSGVPLMDGGMEGRIPPGFEYDGCSLNLGVQPYLFLFRKPAVAAGEQSWDFSYLAATRWWWRVTEWNTGLDPVFPLEQVVSDTATGTSPTSLSTGTTQTTGRSDLVCLAWHHWHKGASDAQSMTWSDHTNGFTIRPDQGELRQNWSTFTIAACWAWKFVTGTGPFETTATINLATRDATDVYLSLLAVYAATTYAA